METLLSSYFDFAMPTYRFLHQPTVTSTAKATLDHSDCDCSLLNRAADATLLIILATALLYDRAGSMTGRESMRERYFQKAQDTLLNEKGTIQLESIQARFAAVLYLLHTSPMNQAWYMLGTSQQLMIALGLHRSRGSSKQAVDCITQECRRRCYWVAFTVDTYLGVMLGRPPLMSDQGVDQRFPTLANDENISAETTSNGLPRRDCVQAAPALHTRLAKIMRHAFALHQSQSCESTQRYVENVIELNREMETWQEGLPLFPSGKIHPFSLITIFRRQLQVLHMASAHATILVNRPLFFVQDMLSYPVQPHVDKCLSSACDILDTVLDLSANDDLFSTFWYFQYMTFHALSVVYIWIILRMTRRISPNPSTYDETQLFDTTERVQTHLAKVTKDNTPNLHYSVILAELRQETERILHKSQQTSSTSTIVVEPTRNSTNGLSKESHSQMESLKLGDAFCFPCDPELWLQIDMIPFDTGSMVEDQQS